MKDSTVIVFTQRLGAEIRIIDFYTSSGEGLMHYAKMLKERGYVYGTHNAPHDIKVRELGTGKTRYEQAMNLADGLAINFNIVDNIPRADGIECVRSILPHCFFDEQKTQILIQHLAEYRKE